MEGRSRIKPFFVAKAGCVAQLDSLQNCRTSLGCMFTHRVIIGHLISNECHITVKET
jgi:hypothetical protein